LPSSSARAPKLDVVNDRGWQREFEDPIPLPDGRMLVTLGDAGNYITSLPKKESALPGMASRNPSADAGVARRTDDAGADRLHEGAAPQ
jgi:hypothetical protein